MRVVVRVHRRGFTLVEVLVTITIIVILVALFGGAISAARSNAQDNTTKGALARLDQVMLTQFRRYESRSVPVTDLRNVQAALGASGTNASAARAWHIRRTMITADMPDRWSDVQYMATTGTSEGFPKTPAQAAYIATWRATNPSERFGGAECLFMIVMQGGIADCLDCNGLAQLKKGDKDGDGALEFWDDWNNPIDYILWAPGFAGSGDTAPFFCPDPADPPEEWKDPFKPGIAVRPGLGMRPLIYSAGADGKYGLNRNPTNPPVTASDTGANAPNLAAGSNPTGRDCGNPNPLTGGTSTMGGPGATDVDRADNVVNVEQKASL